MQGGHVGADLQWQSSWCIDITLPDLDAAWNDVTAGLQLALTAGEAFCQQCS